MVEATSATVSGRRLQQQLLWSVDWDVFVYEQQRDSVPWLLVKAHVGATGASSGHRTVR